MARKARFNLPGIAKGVFSFWGVDALQPDLVLGVVIKDGDRIAIGDLAGGVSSNRQVVMYSLLSRFFYSATITACLMIPLGTIIPQHMW